MNTTIQKSFKTIEKIFTPSIVGEGAGAKVRKIIGGSSQLIKLDPFMMLDHFATKLPGGFPDHPHRGFETVTYMLEGEILHEDFKGNKGRLGPGDLQWMTAGKGILHAEMPGSWEQEAIGFQLWINLAAKDKFCDPQYQEILKDKVPVAEKNGVTVKVIAGEAFGVKGPIFARTPALYFDVHLKPNSTFEQIIPKGWNAFSYVYKGKALYGESKKAVETSSCVVFKKDDKEVLLIETKDEEAKLVLIAGLPLDEPIVKYGPFVLNTDKQLAQTFEDYQFGKNGFEDAPGWESEIRKLSRSKSVLF